MIYNYLSLLLLVILPSTIIAQDISFSQFYNNPIHLNPALAGSLHDGHKIDYNSRLQNPAISNRFSVRNISTDWFTDKLHGGIAVQLANHVSYNQTIVANSISIGYSYHLKLSEKYTLLAGIQFGWHQNFIDWNKLTFGSTIDPIAGFIYPQGSFPAGKTFDNGWGTRGFFNVNSGVAIASEKIYGGIAVKHLNTPHYSFINGPSKLPMLLVLHAGTKIKMSNDLTVSPNAMYTSQYEFNSLVFGFNFQYKIFTIGVYTRATRTAIFSAGIEKKHFRISYSYDHGKSELSNSGLRAHELSFMINF